MSFLGDLVGSTAETASGLIGAKIKNEDELASRNKAAQFSSDLELARQKTVSDLQRSLAASDGAAISSESDRANRQRMADGINQRNGSSMTEEDAKALEGNPDAQKAYGLSPRTRAQEYDDKINAAEGRGLIGQAKELRGQQDVELRRASEERRMTADENRSTAAAAETRRKEQHDEDWRNAQAAKEATANKRLEAILSKSSGSGGNKSEKVMTFMNGQIRQLNSEADDLASQLRADLKSSEFASPEEQKAIRDNYAPRQEALATQRKQLNADFQSLRERFDLPPAKTEPAKEAKDPKAAGILPAGAKQIGTSGGKPVYQTADGKKYIAN